MLSLGLFVRAQKHDGFTFHGSHIMKKDSEDYTDERHIFHLSSPNKLFIHNDLSKLDSPITQVYKVKSYEVVEISKYDWEAYFTVVSSNGSSYKGKLIIEGDFETLMIGSTFFLGSYSVIIPFEKGVLR